MLIAALGTRVVVRDAVAERAGPGAGAYDLDERGDLQTKPVAARAVFGKFEGGSALDAAGLAAVDEALGEQAEGAGEEATEEGDDDAPRSARREESDRRAASPLTYDATPLQPSPAPPSPRPSLQMLPTRRRLLL